MTITQAVEPATEGEDRGLAEHLRAIEDAYQVALAEIAAVAESWTQLPPDPSAVAGGATEELTPMVVRPPVPAKHAA